MPLLVSNKTTLAAQPLSLIKKTTLMPSLTSFTKIFFAKAFPSPRMKLWGTQTSPTGVDELRATGGDERGSDTARGDICEIVVVAIQKVINASADVAEKHDRVSTMGPSRLQKSSIWGSTKWSQGQLHLPHHISCSVRSGTATKVSAQPKRHDSEFVFDEKFIFERREKDAQYHEVTIEVSSVVPGFSKKQCLGQVDVDLDAAFTEATGPIYRQSALQTDDGSESGMEIYYVLHRLVVKNATAAAASRVLTRSSKSLNDDDDMDAYGQIFPDLWYLC